MRLAQHGALPYSGTSAREEAVKDFLHARGQAEASSKACTRSPIPAMSETGESDEFRNCQEVRASKLFVSRDRRRLLQYRVCSDGEDSGYRVHLRTFELQGRNRQALRSINGGSSSAQEQGRPQNVSGLLIWRGQSLLCRLLLEGTSRSRSGEVLACLCPRRHVAQRSTDRNLR